MDNVRAPDELTETMARLRKLAGKEPGSQKDQACTNRSVYGTYHNHTTWSDGRYEPAALVERAIALGFDEIGITDHFDTEKGGIRCVLTEQLTAYREMLAQLAERYAGRIQALAGIEIDTSLWNPKRLALPYDALSRLDYVLFEYVGETRIGGYSLETLVSVRRMLSCQAGLAHPNMRMLIDRYGARELAQVLATHDIFVDACGSARNSRPIVYERREICREFTLNIETLGNDFKQAAREFGVKFVPSSDTHRDDATDSLADTMNAMATLQRYGFQQQRFEPS